MLFEFVLGSFLVLIVWIAFFPTPKYRFKFPFKAWSMPPLQAGSSDLSRWHLDNEGEPGRQVWKYIDPSDKTFKQSFVDRYHTGLYSPNDFPLKKATTPLDAARNGMTFYARVQHDDGHWSQDYGGPMFLIPGFVFTYFISGTPMDMPTRQEFVRYLTLKQNKDGGWGLHSEGDSTVFGSCLNYVTMRMLGVSKDDDRCKRAREFIHANGGAMYIPPWGAFWLATVGLYEWEGMVPLLPELWLLPYALPIHPGRLWCHARMVYLPMSYIYGLKPQAPDHPLVKELRQEIWVEPYDQVDWGKARFLTHERDIFKIHWEKYRGKALWLANWMQIIYERIHLKSLREAALKETLEHLQFDDEYTTFIDIGPVNKAMNMLSVFYAEGHSKNFKQHLDRARDYIFMGVEGLLVSGYNGSQLWDTAFTLQAYHSTGIAHEYKDVLIKGYKYLDDSQVRDNARDPVRYYRHEAKGAWPFSTKTHGWPISDCTSEGLRAELYLSSGAYDWIPNLFTDQRRFDAINVILSYQNSDGGFPTYEIKRSTDLLEYINPSEVFGDIMVDYSYVELTSTCVRTMLLFNKRYPDHRAQEIRSAIERGVAYIKAKQLPDGSFYGSWAVCFTYATWFAVEALILYGEKLDHPTVTRACEFLLSKQSADGGWGEDFNSCRDHVWVPNPKGSQATHTAWAVLTLMRAKGDLKAIKRGIKWLMAHQFVDGNWDYDTILGQFNSSCSIKYNGYKNCFPIWALGAYAQQYGNSID